MIFRLGLKNLRKDPLMNILIVLQMSFAFLILICFISTARARFDLYRPFADELGKKGDFHCILDGIDPVKKTVIRSSDDLANLIEGESEVVAMFEPWLFYGDSEAPQNRISYDRRFVEKFTPKIETGHWFGAQRTAGEPVQVVVSQNDYGLNVGDVVTFESFDLSLQAEVVGILEDNTKIIGFDAPSDGNCDCKNLYVNYSFRTEEIPLFIFCQDELLRTETPMQLNGPVFITYPDDIDDAVIEQNNILLSKMKPINSTPLSTMKKQSLRYIFAQLYDLVPVFLCVLVITLVGAASTAALSAKRQLKNYAVYYICGLRWKQCAMINMWSSLICAAASLVIGTATAAVLSGKGLLSGTVVSLGIWQIIGCFAAAGVYVFLSVLLPLSIIGKNPPREVLKTN